MSRQNQRQLKHSRLKEYAIKNLVVAKNNEGVTSESFPGDAFVVKGEIWPATSKRQIETYGARVNNISNMRLAGQFTQTIMGALSRLILRDGNYIMPGDGVYVLADPETDEPDYRVLSITPYQPARLEIEKR